jgi:ferrous iron transport protein A
MELSNPVDAATPAAAPTRHVEGERGQIAGFRSDYIAGKLMAMGVLPGADVEVLRRAPLGGGWYVRIGAQRLALREDEFDSIIMQ